MRKAIVLSLVLAAAPVLAAIASCDDGGTLAAGADAGAPDATQAEVEAMRSQEVQEVLERVS